jgi:DNA-binding response OmpR family regulator
MTPEKVCRLNILSRQLTESLMSAALCAKEIGEIAYAEIDDDTDGRPDARVDGRRSNGVNTQQRPLLDEATLSVIWRGRTLHLGHTQGFWLLGRLARCPNRYITHLDLMQEIWDDEFADTTLLRAGVRRLRVKLCQGGMSDLADAIAGHRGRYMLNLSAAPRH